MKFFSVLPLVALLGVCALSSTGARAASDPFVPALKGRLELKSMPPSALVGGRQITTWVYLPPAYDAAKNAARRFPVVYLLSGQPGGYADDFRSGKVEEVADSLIESGQLAPMILVAFEGSGPRGAHDLTDFCNRRDGYRVEDFIATDLVSYVDATYRTLPDPQNRALWGYSAGGYGALNIGFKHPDVFRVLCSHAGFYDPADDAPVMQKVLGPRGPLWDENNPLKTVLQVPARTHFAVYMDDSPGEDDYEGFQALARELQTRGDIVQTRSLSKAHSWRIVSEQCRDSLLFAGKNFAASKTQTQ